MTTSSAGLTPSNIPIPDPSAITAAEIAKAKVELRDDIRASISALERVIETRLNGMDRAGEVYSEGIARTPTLLDRETARIIDLLKRFEELVDVKFAGATKERTLLRQAIEQQFSERDVRSDQDKAAASTAINAALSALKEMIGLQNNANAAAITKSEAAVTKQIDSILALLASNTKAIDEKITGINSRLDRGDGGSAGVRQAQTDTRLTIGSVMVLVGGGVAVLSVLATVGIAVFNHAPTQPPQSFLTGPDNTRRVDDLNARLDALTQKLRTP